MISAQCSVLSVLRSVLDAQCSILSAQCLVLSTAICILSIHCSALGTHYSIVNAQYSVLTANCSLLTSLWYSVFSAQYQVVVAQNRCWIMRAQNSVLFIRDLKFSSQLALLNFTAHCSLLLRCRLWMKPSVMRRVSLYNKKADTVGRVYVAQFLRYSSGCCLNLTRKDQRSNCIDS